jgi:hypothetical protein
MGVSQMRELSLENLDLVNSTLRRLARLNGNCFVAVVSDF